MAENGGRLLGLYDELTTFLTQLNLYLRKGLSLTHEMAIFTTLQWPLMELEIIVIIASICEVCFSFILYTWKLLLNFSPGENHILRYISSKFAFYAV